MRYIIKYLPVMSSKNILHLTKLSLIASVIEIISSIPPHLAKIMKIRY